MRESIWQDDLVRVARFVVDCMKVVRDAVVEQTSYQPLMAGLM